MKQWLTIVFATSFLLACKQEPPAQSVADTEVSPATVAAPEADKPQGGGKDYSALIKQAEDLYAKSAELGHAWSINLERLEDARKAAEAGDMETAIANAEEAIKLAELAIRQAEEEKSLWRARVPK